MITIKRHAYCSTQELYELEIDDNYIYRFNERLKSCTPEGVDPVTITAENIADVMGDNETEDNEYLREDRVFKFYWSDSTFTSTLWGYIYDYVNEDLWDSFVETIDSETDDEETWVER